MLISLLLLSLATFVASDTPAHCLFEDVVGTWTFYETERTGDYTQTCETVDNFVHTKNFTLKFPNTVTDEIGNHGTWTLIYNQGFEININGRSYFAFSYYEVEFMEVTSYCDQTFNGWARDKTVRNWSCFKTEKHEKVPPRVTQRKYVKNANQMYKNNQEFVDEINHSQTSWTARVYPQFEKYTNLEMSRRAGGPYSAPPKSVGPAPPSEDLLERVKLLPKHWDWRDVDGVNFVSDIRDQGGCGSCYAFASMANLEANLRIVSHNQRQDIFSPQDPVGCSYLAQGCDGGFDYLIAGRYAMEQGIVSEECNEYTGGDGICATDMSCNRTYVSSYDHVGGYYGACNEQLMMEKLVEHGPISVSFEVYGDFHSYVGGVYHHTEIKNDFNPFEITNHVVLIVGYGVEEETGKKYWIVKNSWGEDWGEDGYFRIIRGVDDCSIESMAVYINVIP